MTRGETINTVVMMDEIIRNYVEDEDLFEEWILYGCPDEASEEDYEFIADNPEEFAETARLFVQLIEKSLR